MKKFLIPLMMMLSLNVMANEKGNGGGMHFCPDRNHQELYDIYEGEARYLIPTVIDGSLTRDEYIDAAVKKVQNVNPEIGTLLRDQIKYLRERKRLIIRKKLKLTPVEDANILMVDEGCRYEQLANWDELSGNIFVKEELYMLMPENHKAALFIHEGLYKIWRDIFKAKNSDSVRRMVAEIMSAQEDMSILSKKLNFVKVLSEDATISLGASVRNNKIRLQAHLGDENYSDIADRLKFNVRIRIPEVKRSRENFGNNGSEYFDAINACDRSRSPQTCFASLRRKLKKLTKNHTYDAQVLQNFFPIYADDGVLNITGAAPFAHNRGYYTVRYSGGLSLPPLEVQNFLVYIDGEMLLDGKVIATFENIETKVGDLPQWGSDRDWLDYEISQNRRK